MKSTRPLFFAAMIAFAVASTPTFADGVAHVPAVPHLRHQIHQHDRHAAATDVAPPLVPKPSCPLCGYTARKIRPADACQV